ncbi:LOW QUALITY PROTEIN: insulin-like growth factor-binding protein complex acid labile subunit [Drosophila albomicans]|uniref:LOW QUALITY PROTEIN: insulin-like growth factor-binding protein complex acid labile subunit n=1 Tax=Drosophila albomicans TaxID=7291 RepID=A0A6P8YF60_DROAB|nr:LOW QUALITY PROTEIN: insulin-like growth factor-binding protein complex acid labile subunit [Drosophila albomicans]
MTSLMYAVFHIATMQCSVRPEISPCTCETGKAPNHVELACEKLESFNAVVDSLANKLNPDVSIDLKITYSQLDDLEMRSFRDMNFNLYKLRMQWNRLRSLPELPFRGLSNVTYLSVGDNELDEIPKHVLNHMPKLQTLDIGRCNIRAVQQDDLKGIQMVTNLILPSNNITRLDRGAFPLSLIILHLGRNQIDSLNGSLHDLAMLQSLFINANNISDLDDELPDGSKLRLLMAHNNRLERLPANMVGMDDLETIHLHFNRLRSFDRVLRNAQYLNELLANNNELEFLAQDEFQACGQMETLNLACNHIRSLNSSLHPMSKLKIGNFSFNDIDEFSMEELQGLRSLKVLDLSYNRIQRLLPAQKVLLELPLMDLRLDHNQIFTLDGALAGLGNLRILSLPENQIEHLLPGDFSGMHRLEILDLTSNQLLDLKPLETTMLPNLKILKVAYNNISKLEHDFFGLPVLCQVNLTNNQISSISGELVTKTRCRNHNVAGKLEIHLDQNPIMCDVHLNELCPLMHAQEARIRGRSKCFEADQEVCTVLPMLYKLELPPWVMKLNMGENEGAKPIVQMILPSPLLIKTKEELPPIIATLGQPIINPVILAAPPALPILLSSTTAAAPVVEPEPEINSTTTTTTTTTTTERTTTTTTTLPPLISSTPIAASPELAATEMVTTTAPTTTTTITTTTTSTATPQEPNVVSQEVQLNPILDVNATVEFPLPVEQPKNEANEEEQLLQLQPPLVATDEADQQHERVADTVAKTEYETVDYIPNEVVRPTPPQPQLSKSNLLEEDSDSQSNSVHEEYSSVLLADMEHAAQNLQIPEEPPEE